MPPKYLPIKEAAERIKVTPAWLLQYASEGCLQLFALVRRDICILPEPVPLETDGRPLKAEIRHIFDMEKRIVYEGGTYISMGAKELMLIQRSHEKPYPITIKDFFINDRKYDIAGEPFASFGKVHALPGQWDISEDDLCFRVADIDNLIEAHNNQNPVAPAAKVKDVQGTSPSDDAPDQMKTGAGTSLNGDDVEEQAPAADTDDHDETETLAALFDPVPVDVLEKMFPADGKWQSWTQRAARKGLVHARVGTAMYNPYKAGMWFVTNGGKGLTIGHCRRMLANNHLPDRSTNKKYLLTGELD